MRADVVERAHLLVVAANDDQRHARRMREEPVVVRRRQLRLVAGDDPGGLEELLLLLLEDLRVGVDARVDVMAGRKFRRGVPLRFALAHGITSVAFILCLLALERQERALLCSCRVSPRNMCRWKQRYALTC